jgi:hypothetical protein
MDAGGAHFAHWERQGRQDRHEVSLPSLLRFSGKAEPGRVLPPLAVMGTAPSVLGLAPAPDSLIRPVLPRYDYQPQSEHPSGSSWEQLAPNPLALPNARSSDPPRRPVESGTAQMRYLPEKRRKLNQGPRKPLPSLPPSRTRQAEPAAEQNANNTALNMAERRPRVRTQRRREQCRTNQARYRMRQNRRIQEMEDTASRIREEIALLLLHRAHWSEHGVSERTGLMARYIVEDLFRRLRSGVSGANVQLPLFATVPTDDPGSPTSSSPTSKVVVSYKAECNGTYVKQVAFLRTVFLEDADIGDGLFGPDAVLEQWWRFSCYFKRVHLTLDTMTTGPSHTGSSTERATAAGTLSLKIGSHSMQHVFPHLDPSGSESGALMDQQLKLPVRVEFEFMPVEGSFCRIARAEIDIDFISELLRVVGTADALERVLAGALISPQGFIGELEGHPTGVNGV